MVEYVEWLRQFIVNYPALQYIVVFLGAAFGGELAVISLAFLAAQGIFPLMPFFLVSFLGTLSSDVLWFLLGNTKFVGKLITHKYAHGTVSLLTETIRRVSRGSHLLALIMAKMMVGTRVILIMYIGKTDIHFKKFIVYDAVSVVLWLLVVMPIGFVSGLGFTYLSNIFENIYAGIGFVLLFAALIVLLQLWLKKRLTEEAE
jgi:membrane protein DedA with SNARE-associated domain